MRKNWRTTIINWFDVPSESPNKDLTLKNLQVTENGTYGESGVAYSSVEVDVNGGGGGGSSDFNTAEVTIVGEINTSLIYISETEGFECVTNGSQTFSGKVKVPLYKGACVNLADIPIYSNLVVTGDAEILEEGEALKITGDCTIAVNDK